MLLWLSIAGVAAHGAEARLSVTTYPSGVEVWLNDKYIGDSPIVERVLPPGQYALRLVDPLQRTSLNETIELPANEHIHIEKTITGKFGSLHITTDPPGAELSLSTKLGKTPLKNDYMTPGTYRLKIEHPARIYKPVTKDVVVNRGETVSLNETLERRNEFDRVALARLALGVGAIGGFVWSLIEQRALVEQENKPPEDYDKERVSGHRGRRTLGIVIGSVCVTGFEILAFF
jgi:hypothetical protein